MFSGHGSPWYDFAHAVRRLAAGQFFERLRLPSMWIDAAELAVFDERGDHRPVVAALVWLCQSASKKAWF